jgi:hypothetical protein
MENIPVNNIPLGIFNKSIVRLAVNFNFYNGTFGNIFGTPDKFQRVNIQGNRFYIPSVQHRRDTTIPPNSAGLGRTC